MLNSVQVHRLLWQTSWEPAWFGEPHPRQGGDIHLVRLGNSVQSRIGREHQGFDLLDDHFTQRRECVPRQKIRRAEFEAEYTRRRVGAAHPSNGKDVQLERGQDSLLEVVALVAVCAFKRLEDHQNNAAALSSAL